MSTYLLILACMLVTSGLRLEMPWGHTNLPMDRTAEFYSLLDASQKEEKLVQKQRFYEDIYTNVNSIIHRAAKSTTYKTLLELDRELNTLIKKSTELLDGLKMAGTEDLQMHFDGVKMIINRKFVEASRCLARKQAKEMQSVELEPERPVAFRNVAENQRLEQESKSIVESVQYEATRQRLMKIEAVQKAIHQNLLIQDERIDRIGVSHGSTTEIYRTLNTETSLGSGSFFKRATTTVIVCLTLVLVFVHVFYRGVPAAPKKRKVSHKMINERS